MTHRSTFRLGLVKVFVYSLLSLFLIPAATYVFTVHAQREHDAHFMVELGKRIDALSGPTSAGKQLQKDFYRSHPPSTICSNTDAQVEGYREAMCSPFSPVWQFYVARTVALWTLAAGAVLLLSVLALGALAFVDRSLQYASFVTGWGLLAFSTAAEFVVQGAMVVWLSFWVTAFFFHSYYIKLIMLAGLLVGGAVFLAVMGIFKRVHIDNAVAGELVTEADAPRLWRRIRAMAQRLKTAAPQHIVAGIDANFFVTEAPLVVGTQKLTGRTLFVSIPLLRLLDQAQADAVFGHELAHLRSGDTRSSAQLGPKRLQFDHYCRAMREAGCTTVALPLLELYRTIFEIALARDSREREFKADRMAAKLVSPQAIGQSLLKIAAYAQYRSKIEGDLFDTERRHGNTLGIASYVAQGLSPYADSPEFLQAMKTANVPHPFDSHPQMHERMQNVGVALQEQDYGAIVTAVPQTSWARDILTADAIEKRLWSEYEQAFAQGHERSLAYRYGPNTAEEQALVLKFFPPVVFDLKEGETVDVSYAGISTSASETLILWDSIKALKFSESTFGNSLVITHPEKGLLGVKASKIKLAGLTKEEKDRFNTTVGHYWQRHLVMRGYQAIR